jgi:hypothetical protein
MPAWTLTWRGRREVVPIAGGMLGVIVGEPRDLPSLRATSAWGPLSQRLCVERERRGGSNWHVRAMLEEEEEEEAAALLCGRAPPRHVERGGRP